MMLQTCVNQNLFLYTMIAAGTAGIWCLFWSSRFYSKAIRDLQRLEKPKLGWTRRILKNVSEREEPLANPGAFLRNRIGQGQSAGMSVQSLKKGSQNAAVILLGVLAVSMFTLYFYEYETYLLVEYAVIGGVLTGGLLLLRLHLDFTGKEETLLEGWTDYLENDLEAVRRAEHTVRQNAETRQQKKRGFAGSIRRRGSVGKEKQAKAVVAFSKKNVNRQEMTAGLETAQNRQTPGYTGVAVAALQEETTGNAVSERERTRKAKAALRQAEGKKQPLVYAEEREPVYEKNHAPLYAETPESGEHLRKRQSTVQEEAVRYETADRGMTRYAEQETGGQKTAERLSARYVEQETGRQETAERLSARYAEQETGGQKTTDRRMTRQTEQETADWVSLRSAGQETAVRQPTPADKQEEEQIRQVREGIRQTAAADSRFSGMLSVEEEQLLREIIREYMK